MILDYASLQTAIADWLARADLTARIPTFIQLAEQRFARDLRVKAMQATVTGAAVAGKIQVPDDCRELQSVRIELGSKFGEIRPLPPVWLSNPDTTDFPRGYVVVGEVLHLIGGAATAPYALTYFQDIPDLATSPMNRNWLLQREPGLYLYGALLEASPYLGDDARTMVWVEQYKDILQGMQVEDDRARYGNAPAMMTMRGMP